MGVEWRLNPGPPCKDPSYAQDPAHALRAPATRPVLSRDADGLAAACNEAKVLKHGSPAVATEPGRVRRPRRWWGHPLRAAWSRLPDAATPIAGGVDAGAAGDPMAAAPCQPATCTPTGGKYCGQIGDGCGGTLGMRRRLPDGADLRRRRDQEPVRRPARSQLPAHRVLTTGRAAVRPGRRRLRRGQGLRRAAPAARSVAAAWPTSVATATRCAQPAQLPRRARDHA